ncbi:CRISPR-associated protein Cas5 [Phormidium sp. CCY1219]|uniref:CRISPR-associated protein Cas5 n=1 Tax=Phormidium sp. CCY1219 TaxID=2886104 RepID=UPI002D1F16A8|nr:CRISPR-associated protein Cas5 [Phormidium sp. CCY1219]MEB3828823.1 CRISPR-associated protein Cas5 [Phormidium sp. CCY1219]
MTNYLWIRAIAPFAAYRYFQAGSYRSTMPILPPSAALGLVLNLAAIEMRESVDDVTTQIRKDIPHLCLAIGTITPPERTYTSTLYQQLHSYPVGKPGENLKEYVQGQKYWIVPVRREILANLDMAIALKNPEDGLVDRILRGLNGEFNAQRYGLPFAGDNNLLFDRLEILQRPPETYWYERIELDAAPKLGTCRLTVGINRKNNSETTSFLYAPVEEPSIYPPDSAWTWTPKAPDRLQV